jgi:NAD(P)-dependent dehydrogenase (short-subunit alcohol dehydrogenase family)
MTSHHHVLLLGGHGKVAQLLTPLLLRRGWDVTSVIRSEEQVGTVHGLAGLARRDGNDGDESEVGKLNVLVRSLEEVKSEGDAKRVLDEVGADYAVWSAGMFTLTGPHSVCIRIVIWVMVADVLGADHRCRWKGRV